MGKVTKDLVGAPFPTPVVLATTIGPEGDQNVITLAWVGVACSKPLMLSLAIRPSRHSHALLDITPELVVNMPTRNILEKTDFCGTVSGREVDKFVEAGLTAAPADIVKAPLIEECPVNLECKVVKRLSLGTHDLFLVEVVRAHVEEEALDDSGKVDFTRLELFVYAGLDYLGVAEKIGHYGFTKKR